MSIQSDLSNVNLPPPHDLFQTIYHKKSKSSLTFPPNSRWTKQSFAAECDINTIMSRYQSTGEMPVLNLKAPQYLDCPSESFQDMLEFVKGAQDLFMELPSSLRNRFSNDPAKFLDFCSNEENRPEMINLGLIAEPETPPQASIST